MAVVRPGNGHGVKFRLYAGSINNRPDEDGWRNFVLDITPRAVWDRDLSMGVLPDFVMDIAELPEFREGMWDEIVAHHVLEHLSRPRAEMALASLNRILAPDGTLDIEVPDVAKVCKAWLHDELDHPGLVQWLYGEQLAVHEPGDSHRYAWTADLLAGALREAEYVPGPEIDAGYACRFRAVKA